MHLTQRANSKEKLESLSHTPSQSMKQKNQSHIQS